LIVKRTFACHGALRLRSDEERVLTPLSEENLRPACTVPQARVSGAAVLAA